MHDIDRNQTEFEYEMENTPFQSYEMEESPYQSEEPVFNEVDEMQLTSDLMELNTEEEFENFLTDLIKKAAGAVGGYISSQTGQSLGSLLKGAARQLLPVVSQAVGAGESESDEFEDEFEGDGSSTQEFESQEFESEEQEWEAATTFVKLAGEAAKIAAQAPPDAPPAVVADQAVTQAAQTHAPALLEPPPAGPAAPRMRHRRRQGRWIRRGNQIILLGA